MARPVLLLAVLALSGCKDEEEPVDDTGTPDVVEYHAVDLLLVLDSSDSNGVLNTQLAFAMDDFMSSAVSKGIDLQVSMTVAQMDEMLGGKLLVEPTPASAGGAEFREKIFCEAGCFDQESITQVEDYECTDPVTDPEGVISAQYLDCICGPEVWRVANCPGGAREFLEVAFISFCRAQEDMAALCTFGTSRLTLEDANTNPGLIREGAQPWVVTITDDGDKSESIGVGNSDVSAYIKSYDQATPDLVYNVMGPPYEGGTASIPCYDGGAESWNILRLQNIVEETGGLWGKISYRGTNQCEDGDVAAFLSSVLATMPK